jgi:hypothetical protein
MSTRRCTVLGVNREGRSSSATAGPAADNNLGARAFHSTGRGSDAGYAWPFNPHAASLRTSRSPRLAASMIRSAMASRCT